MYEPLIGGEGEKVPFLAVGNTIITLTIVRQSIPAAGTDPVTLFKKLPRKVSNLGDSSLLPILSGSLYFV